jgi:hypothetical protein
VDSTNTKSTKSKEVSFPPQLELETSIRKWGDKQFAVSTVKATTEERPKGSRQVKAPARLGHYTSGKKGIDMSVGATTVPKLVEHIDESEDDSDKLWAGHIPLDNQQCVLIPGKYSLIRPGEVEELEDQLSSTTDDAQSHILTMDKAVVLSCTRVGRRQYPQLRRMQHRS